MCQTSSSSRWISHLNGQTSCQGAARLKTPWWSRFVWVTYRSQTFPSRLWTLCSPRTDKAGLREVREGPTCLLGFLTLTAWLTPWQRERGGEEGWLCALEPGQGMTLTSLQTSSSPCHYNDSYRLSHWYTHTPPSSFQNYTSGPDYMPPLTAEAWCIICCAVSPPASLIHQQWRTFVGNCFPPLIRPLWCQKPSRRGDDDSCTLIEDTPTPQQPQHIHTHTQPQWPASFDLLIFSRGLHLLRSNWWHGFASLQAKWRGGGGGGWKTSTTIWRWGPEYESQREWKQSSSCDILQSQPTVTLLF